MSLRGAPAPVVRTCEPIGRARLARGSDACAAIVGGRASVWLHTGRRVPNTAIAIAATASPWLNVAVQCCVERFERISCVPIRSGPSATGLQKFTVSETTSPSRSGRSSIACSSWATVIPP